MKDETPESDARFAPRRPGTPKSDIPPELRGVSPDPVREPRTPAWVRVVALLLVVALVGYFVISAF
jgi:hypothetical protein